MNKKAYFKNLQKQYRPFILLFFIIALAEPLIFLLTGKNNFMVGMGGPEAAQHALSTLTMPIYFGVLTLIFSFVAPFIVFGYLYRKSDLDNYFSMPATRKELFRSQYFFTMTMMVILPVLLGYILRSLILVAQIHRYFRFQGPFELGKLIYLGLMLVVGAFVLSIPSILSIICTTTLFNGVIYSIVLHAILPILISFIGMVQGNAVGKIVEMTDAGNKLYFLSYDVMHMDLFIDNRMIHELWLPMLIWLGIAVGLFFLANYLFSRRKVDRIRTGFMFRGFYPVMIISFGTLLMTMSLYSSIFMEHVQWSSLFSSHMAELLILFFIGFVIFLVVELARYQGRPPILKGLLAYFLIFVLSTGLAYGAAGPYWEKQSLKMPGPKQVASIRIYNPSDADSEYMERIHDQDHSYEPLPGEDTPVPPCILKAADSGKRDEQGRPILKDHWELDLPPEHAQEERVYFSKAQQTNYYQEAEIKDPAQIRAIMDFQKEQIQIQLAIEKQSMDDVQYDPKSGSYISDGPFSTIEEVPNKNPARTEMAELPEDWHCNPSVVFYIQYLNRRGKVLDQRVFCLDPNEPYRKPEEVKKDIETMAPYFNGKLYYQDGRVYEP